MSVNSTKVLIPFLKWAGGKRWFLANYRHLIPDTIGTYFEPFLGGGALFFELQPLTAVLSDTNAALINVYNMIKSDWRSIERHLETHQNNHSKDYYYKMRSLDIENGQEAAARFLYLNRTCWNGLFRVNLNGKFNVPIGTKNSVILDSDNFKGASDALSNAGLFVSDFEDILNNANKGDFIFADPPYTVKHNFNGFNKYNEKLFSWDDQIRLRDCLENAATRGANVLVTNADHQSIRKIYSGFGKISVIQRSSVLAADPQYRSQVTELAISC